MRKSVKWGGTVATLVLLVVWIGSGWWCGQWITPAGGVMLLTRGHLSGVGYIVPPIWTDYCGDFTLHRTPFQWHWWAGLQVQGEPLIVPLWLPALLSLLATAAAWRADAKYLRRAREGACPARGYDRAGLAAGAVCPECGAAAGVQGVRTPEA